MKQSITKCQFHDAFRAYNKLDNFTYDGLSTLFDYFEEYQEDTGCEIELDVIAICCEYTEYKDIEEFQSNYGNDFETIEVIQNHTTVIRVNDESFIIQDF